METTMFKNNCRYITKDDTREDYIELDLKLDSLYWKWKNAIEIMERRIKGRYLEPMRILIEEDPDKNGFAAMALCCLLIETLMQFRQGSPSTPRGMNRQYYTAFLKNQLKDVYDGEIRNVFDGEMANRFYGEIRCGILHSAQTKNNACLTYNRGYIARIQGNDVLMVDVVGMYCAISDYFIRYCDDLGNPRNEVLRRNFINKMDDITNKWEGTNIIDKIWFAICEKENREIALPNGISFSFRVDGDTLRIPNTHGLREIRNRVNITKGEIERALYYWPNTTSIKMLKNGHYIYSILCLCSDGADDIITREII